MRRSLPLLVFLVITGCSSKNTAPSPLPPPLPPTPPVALATAAPPTATVTPAPTPQPTATPLAAALIGTWRAEGQSVVGLAISRLTFYPDGTVVLDDILAKGQPVQYSLAGDRLKLQGLDGRVVELRAVLSTFDGGLTLSEIDKPTIATVFRRSDR